MLVAAMVGSERLRYPRIISRGRKGSLELGSFGRGAAGCRGGYCGGYDI